MKNRRQGPGEVSEGGSRSGWGKALAVRFTVGEGPSKLSSKKALGESRAEISGRFR